MVAIEYKEIVDMSVRVLVSVYQKAPFVLYNANQFERRDNNISRRNENRLFVIKEWLFVNSELERSSGNY